MGSFVDLSTAAKRFRLVAFVEAISWALLIVGMVYKRLPEPHRETWPVQVFGMAHGVVFLVFLAVAVLAARKYRWSPLATVLALLSSLPPFTTVVFEIWAARTGRLGELSAAPAMTPGRQTATA